MHGRKWNLVPFRDLPEKAQGPFSNGNWLKICVVFFKLRERCQNLSSGEEQIVIGKNKWGKTEALDRGEGGKKGKNIQFPFLSKARDISPSVFCC